MRQARKPLVLDSTVLSNFASSESVSWLVSAFSELKTAPAVERELRRGLGEGHRFLRPALAAIESGEISVLRPASDAVHQSQFSEVFRRLDRGEAEALVAAVLEDGTLVTDDGAARRFAGDRGVPKTGSIGLLVNGIVRDELSVERADGWLNVWREKRDYYAPVETVAEALPNDTT